MLAMIAILSYTVNTYLFIRLKDYSVILAAILEEFLKTYGGFLVGYILITHLTFGIIEGLVDIRNNGTRGILPSIFSVLGHWAFGYLTIVVFNLTGTLLYGVLTGIFTHVIYNSMVIGLVNNINKRP